MSVCHFAFIEWRPELPLTDEALHAASGIPVTLWLDDEDVVGKIVRVERCRGALRPKICVVYELETFSTGALSLDVRFSDGTILRAAYMPTARALRVCDE